MIGVGAAMVTSCYNTCFTISDDVDNEHFLVDAGGGNGILAILEKMGIPIFDIHNAFVSHNHSDHLLGMVWVIRTIAQHINRGRYVGNLNIYAHPKSIEALRVISSYVMQKKLTVLFDNRILFHPIADGVKKEIGGRSFTFFDIQSTKELQHGFSCILHNGKKVTFLGDEPYNESEEMYARDADLLMQEAYCQYSEVEKYRPYEKHHGTVLDSARNAQSVNAKATLLFHTEGKTPRDVRQDLYRNEAMSVFSGTVYVPNDMDVIEM